jgi:hypothetical protein
MPTMATVIVTITRLAIRHTARDQVRVGIDVEALLRYTSTDLQSAY